VLQLEFDTVVPGHGLVTTKQEMRKFRESTQALLARTREMVAGNRSKEDITKMLRSEFKWADLHLQMGLDGLIAESK
jgi:hypothetical protein